MKFEGWYLLFGAMMLGVTLLDQWLKRLPITTTIIYLIVGVFLGPLGFGVISIDPVGSASFLERVTELAVIVSLFTAGLKLRSSLRDLRWWVPVRLAFTSMFITVGLITIAGVLLLDLPVGAAVLLGAVLAPTDPVLASDVQVAHPGDRDRLRFSLTGEAGLNDGTAFPFVMLGLGLMGLHNLGEYGLRWFTVDLVWAIAVGLAIGGALGLLVRKMVEALRRRRQETVGRDEFIALGLIGASYGLALMAHAYGFLAVFAAGLAFARIDASGVQASLDEAQEEGRESAGDAASKTSRGVLQANEQLERLLEIGLVLLLGGMLSRDMLALEAVWFVPLLFLIIRPLAVQIGVWGMKGIGPTKRILMSWFGIRGIGSLYYLMFAIAHGVPEAMGNRLTSIVFSVVAASILIHGISVTPIMDFYERRKRRKK